MNSPRSRRFSLWRARCDENPAAQSINNSKYLFSTQIYVLGAEKDVTPQPRSTQRKEIQFSFSCVCSLAVKICFSASAVSFLTFYFTMRFFSCSLGMGSSCKVIRLQDEILSQLCNILICIFKKATRGARCQNNTLRGRDYHVTSGAMVCEHQ